MNIITGLGKKSACALLGIAMLLGASASATAAPITLSAGGSQAFSFTGTGNGYTFDTSGVISVASIVGNLLTVNFTVNNNAKVGGLPIPTPANVRLTSFGFGIDPNVSAVAFSDPGDVTGLTAASLDSIPSLKSIEVCAYSGPNCSGGAGGGIFAEQSDSFTLFLTGPWGTSVTFDPLGVKYQTNLGSTEFYNYDCTSTGGCTQVPEPASVALLGLGLAGFAFARKRK